MKSNINVKIEDGTELDVFRALLEIHGKDTVMGFDDSFDENDVVDSGTAVYSPEDAKWFLTKKEMDNTIDVYRYLSLVFLGDSEDRPSALRQNFLSVDRKVAMTSEGLFYKVGETIHYGGAAEAAEILDFDIKDGSVVAITSGFEADLDTVYLADEF